MNQTAMTHLSSVRIPAGLVMVSTKTKYLVFFDIPRTRVMLYQGRELIKGASVNIRYNTTDPRRLDQLHAAVVQALADVGLKSFTDSARGGSLPLAKQAKHLLRFVKHVA
jgi:hypothetical protein